MTYTPYRRYRHPRRSTASSFKLFAGLIAGVFFLVLILMLISHFWSKVKSSSQDDLVLTLLQGKATLMMAGGPEQSLALTQFMYEGDSIQSLPGAKVRVEFPGGAEIILDEQSRLKYEHFIAEEGLHHFEVELLEGRMWLNQNISPMNVHLENIQVRAGVFQALSTEAEYLLELGEEDRIAVWNGEVNMSYLDPESSQEIDSLRLVKGDMTRFNLEKRALFLSRRPVNLLETFNPEDLLALDFVRFVKNPEALVPETQEEAEEISKEVPEEVPEEETPEKVAPVKQTSIKITNLASSVTLSKPAQAIEGSIQNPEDIVAVEVAWSGTGVFYPLSLYLAGSDSFRYVADLAYGNLQEGQNTYRIRAKKADGSYTPEVQVRLTLPAL